MYIFSICTYKTVVLMGESCSTMTPGTLNLCELYVFTIVLMGMYCWVIPTIVHRHT